MEKVIRASRQRAGWEIPWFVAQVSYWGPDRLAFPTIRDAQAALWASGIVFEGPDTDTLTGEFRQNNGKDVHFSAKGLEAHGRLWAGKTSAWLDYELNLVVDVCDSQPALDAFEVYLFFQPLGGTQHPLTTGLARKQFHTYPVG